MIHQTRLLMGMPITIELIDSAASAETLDWLFGYFEAVDQRFSTYKSQSEISRINAGELTVAQASFNMQAVFALAERTRQETDGYFDIWRNNAYDPSGLVKGWAIYQAALLLWQAGFQNFFVDAGGDVQTSGRNRHGQPWRVGIRNPFNAREIVKVLTMTTAGLATSGTYVRGQHIYDPINPDQPLTDIVSMSVIGSNIYEADRLATAAFAMGRAGILFIEKRSRCEGYMIDAAGQATCTSGFERYLAHG
jgi:thiamine biosynthesis lipoprotein